MSRIPMIRSVMTPFPYAIDADAPLTQARAMMVEHGVRHLPVTHDDQLVGVVTDRDLKRALDPSLGLPPRNELYVKDVCVFEPYVVDMGEPLDRVLRHLAQTHIGSALVVRKGRVVGIFTTIDACRCFAEHLGNQAPGVGDDAA